MNITLKDIEIILVFIVSLMTSIEFLLKKFKNQIRKILEPINENINNIDISQCKNFLVKYLSDIENNRYVTEAEKQRAYEIYDHYTNDLKQNSYIHNKWDVLIGGNNEK